MRLKQWRSSRLNEASGLPIDVRGSGVSFTPPAVIQPRKLAAIDIAFLGRPLIVAEFAAGVLLGIALGAFILIRARSPLQVAFGLYIVAVGLNYVPMLLYALAIKDRDAARAEIAGELNNRPKAMAKYRWQSLYLLVPLVTPTVALRDHFRQASL